MAVGGDQGDGHLGQDDCSIIWLAAGRPGEPPDWPGSPGGAPPTHRWTWRPAQPPPSPPTHESNGESCRTRARATGEQLKVIPSR